MAMVFLTRWVGVLLVIPGSVLAETPQGAPPAGPVVQMAPYEVKEDPLRTWGMHAGFVINLLARIKEGTVFAVRPGSGAAQAGLHPGDRLVSFNGQPIEKMSIFSLVSKAKAALAAGSWVELGVRAPGSTEVRRARFKFSPERPRLWPPLDFGRQGRPPPRLPPAPRTADIWPAVTWSDAGNGSPRAALETMFFDREHGDLEGLTRLLEFEPAAKKKLEALFLALSPSGKSYYGTPERLMAALVETEVLPAGLRILKETGVNPDKALLQANVRFFDDFYQQSYPIEFSLVRLADGWKWEVSAAAVKAYAEYYAHVPFALAPAGSSAGLPWLYFSQ
jgi:hypothetical protein